MRYKFYAYGHHNILATHKTTLEFTKDENISLRGDCIIGVNADFELNKLKRFIKKTKNKKIIITIKTSDKKIKEKIIAEINLNFSMGKELVIRRTDFVSERTFAIRANKAAYELKRPLIDFLKKGENKIAVIVENIG